MIEEVKNLPPGLHIEPIGWFEAFSREASTSWSPGPVMVFLPKLPYVPGDGIEKAQGSYHRLGVLDGVPAGIVFFPILQPAQTPHVGLLL
jgi:hypothetical protein